MKDFNKPQRPKLIQWLMDENIDPDMELNKRMEEIQKDLLYNDTEATRLLTKLRKIYLVEIDHRTGEPKASMNTILKTWDEVNNYLNIKIKKHEK